MRTDYVTHKSSRLGSLIYNSGGGILGDTAHAESVPPDLAAGIAEGRYFVAVDDGIPGNGPQPGDWLSSITAVIPKMAAFVAAEDFARVNANRAAAGLEPVRVLQYGPQCSTLSGTEIHTTRKARHSFTPDRSRTMQLSRSTTSTQPGSLPFQDRHAQHYAPARLGAWVQNPETGDWYDDGTGALVNSPMPATEIPGALPSASAQPSDWLSAITGALPKVSAFLTAEQLAQVNIDRAKRGQPALQTSQYAPQVGVGLDPGTAKLVTMIGLGLGAVILIPKFLKRGSRRR